ncbi:MAG TPA: methylenetetrahydrofolate reductase, partial [Candidatus Sulfotelmatobacter sp.]|nr:methylenetetrahydrofolate reductase [Candidatus Sulfotelmatobacter sp.]
MKVTEAFNKAEPALSFEFFPPKTAEKEAQLFNVLDQLKQFRPDFASVTCGAMGTNKDKTLFWAKEIKEKHDIESVAHLTCVAADRVEIDRQLDELSRNGIENILALRGDPPIFFHNNPSSHSYFTPSKDGFRYASELVEHIKKNHSEFCIGVAGYPEGHRDSPSKAKDVEFLKKKVDKGAEYIITQFFFDNNLYFEFVKHCRAKG